MEIDHRALGAQLFNRTWSLLDQETRTADDDAAMVNVAHASLHHWSEASSAVRHRARGEWLISRVYAVLGRGEPAVHHAQRCGAWCDRGEVEDWDRAFAYEALARAHSVAADPSAAASYRELARAAGDAIADPEDRAQFELDFATLPTPG